MEPLDVILFELPPMEDFYAYLAGAIFRRQGYLLTERCLGPPLTADFYAYRCRQFGSGAFLLELCLGLGDIEVGDAQADSILFELEDERKEMVSGSEKQGYRQATAYIRGAGGYFNKAYLVGPLAVDLCDPSDRRTSEIGVMTWDGAGCLRIKESPNHASEELQALVLKEAEALFRRARCAASSSRRREPSHSALDVVSLSHLVVA